MQSSYTGPKYEVIFQCMDGSQKPPGRYYTQTILWQTIEQALLEISKL